jgi:hypothetical protein
MEAEKESILWKTGRATGPTPTGVVRPVMKQNEALNIIGGGTEVMAMGHNNIPCLGSACPPSPLTP